MGRHEKLGITSICTSLNGLSVTPAAAAPANYDMHAKTDAGRQTARVKDACNSVLYLKVVQ